jgi:hypothetical protein
VGACLTGATQVRSGESGWTDARKSRSCYPKDKKSSRDRLPSAGIAATVAG